METRQKKTIRLLDVEHNRVYNKFLIGSPRLILIPIILFNQLIYRTTPVSHNVVSEWFLPARLYINSKGGDTKEMGEGFINLPIQ